MNISDVQDAIKGGKSADDVAADFTQTIIERNSEINAFLNTETLFRADTPTDHPLNGVPIAIKDVLMTKGHTTTAGSRMLENYTATYDAHVVTELKRAGATLLGKTNCDEFAMGASNENSAFGPVKNPVNTEYVPGGSSGGSAAAVASDMCVAALGSDTGGSIRQPAAFCGIVGLKPTYGRVSRYGLIALCSSLDTIGPFTHNVKDAATVLETIAGFDPRDMTTAPLEVPKYTQHLEEDIKGLKVGVPKEFFVDGMDSGVEKATRAAIKKLESLGAEIQEVSLPHTKYAVPTYYVILPAEASSNLARFDGVRYGVRTTTKESPEYAMDKLLDQYLSSRANFGAEPKRRMMTGTFVLSAGYADQYYKKAQAVRAMMKQEMDDVFQAVDILVSPTTPTTAFKFGERMDDPVQMYLSDVMTSSANITGIPAISIPSGTANDLPVGFQIMGKAFDEQTILRAAHQLEAAL